MAFRKELALIIDKDNFLGSKLAQSLSPDMAVVLITREHVVGEGDVIVVPYVAPFPQIPEGRYTNIFWVWNEKDSELMEPLVQKAKEQSAQLFVVATKDKREKLVEQNPPGILLVLGDVFDASEKFALGKFLQRTKATKRIALSNMGLHEWHPVLLTDAVKKIAENVLRKRDWDKEHFVGPKHEYTALSIAHGLQKTNPDLVIDFVQDKDSEGDKFHVRGSIFDSYDAIKALRETYGHTFAKKIKEASVSVVLGSHAKKSKKGWWGGYVFYLILLSVLLPFVFVATCAFLGYFLLAGGLDDLKNGNFAASLQKTKAADINFSVAQDALVVAGMEAKVIGQERIIALVEKQVANGRTTAKIMKYGAEAIGAFSNIITGKTTSTVSDAEVGISAVKQEVLLLQSIDLTSLPQQYREDVKSLRQVGDVLSGVIDEAPGVLGIGKDVSYLVLFQNNMELRSGGGFIGSYGILKLHNGAIKKFSIHDVYDADGQLKGHVEPPFAIRRYIPIVHLYLRDSNFDPDFTVNAKTAALLLSQETGEQVNGVIGVDLTALKTLLAGVGSVYVPSYSETVTKDNFFTLTEQHAEKGFFPGSTQKKEFLQAFAQALFAKLQQKKQINVSLLLSGAVSVLYGKDVTIAFGDPAMQQPFSLGGLSNTLIDKRPNSPTIFNDFLGIVEANLGVNKVNAFVTRSVSHHVTIDKNGDAVEKVIVSFTNNSDGVWPGGVYKNYLRFLLPQSATVENISIDNVTQQIVSAVITPKIYEAKSFVAPKGLEVDKQTEADKSVYGMLITVPEKKTMEIEINYVVPRVFLLTDQKQTYNLFVWKQAGVDAYPYDFSLTIPDNMQFINADGQVFTYTGEIAKDTTLQTSLAKR